MKPLLLAYYSNKIPETSKWMVIWESKLTVVVFITAPSQLSTSHFTNEVCCILRVKPI